MGADLWRIPPRTARRGAGALIDIEDLTVRFGGVTPLDGMTVRFEQGTCGLIGPNGAGKTTFFNVLSGFVRPAAGSVRAFGEDLLRMADYRRARWGLRRTFQQEQAMHHLRRHVADVERIDMDGRQFPFGLGGGAHRQ